MLLLQTVISVSMVRVVIMETCKLLAKTPTGRHCTIQFYYKDENSANLGVRGLNPLQLSHDSQEQRIASVSRAIGLIQSSFGFQDS
jgi:hypothetical protein